MKKVISSILVFILLVVAADFMIGGLVEKSYHASKYGIFHRQNYILNELNEDIVVLGSSRACHHYVPSIISDSLGMSCYNAGSDGMCIYYHYAMLTSMIERGHIPQIVIYDMLDTDVSTSSGATFTLDAAIERLMPHYGEFSIIDSLIDLKGRMEHLKMQSKLYRYNSKLVQLIKCNFIPSPEDNGYEAVFGRLNEDKELQKAERLHPTIEENKVLYFKKLLTLSKKYGFKLILVRSPWYAEIHSASFLLMKELAEEKGFQVLDMVNEENLMKPELFKDESHLNDEGAHLFTRVFVECLDD